MINGIHSYGGCLVSVPGSEPAFTLVPMLLRGIVLFPLCFKQNVTGQSPPYL